MFQSKSAFLNEKWPNQVVTALLADGNSRNIDKGVNGLFAPCCLVDWIRMVKTINSLTSYYLGPQWLHL